MSDLVCDQAISINGVLTTPERRRGRPSLVHGERSVEYSVTLEASLEARLEAIAKVERVEIHELIRIALREYSRKKLPSAPA